MNNFYYTYTCLLLLLGCTNWGVLHAQDSITTQQIPEFTVSEKVEAIFSKINTQDLDSSLLSNNNTTNLGTVLAKNTAVSVRSYGVTGISSVSMRGGNANHVAVLWNGFNVQDPLNGGVNFAQSSCSFSDQVQIQYGGCSTAFGSGAVGGVIHLNNKPQFNNAFHASAMVKTGSFGLNAQHLQFGMGNQKVATQVRLFHSSVQNDFEFNNLAKINAPLEQYQYANSSQFGALHEFYYRLRANQLLSSQFWYQHNFREVPGNMTALRPEGVDENLTDDWIRWGLNWKRTGVVVNYEARTGLFYNKSIYENSVLDLLSHNNSVRNSSEALAVIQMPKEHRLTFGVLNTYTQGMSDNFNNNPKLNTTSVYLAPSLKLSSKTMLNASIRQEYYQDGFTPLTYSLNTKVHVYRNWYTTASFSRNYRTPNFNDLYWKGGYALGNLGLKSEEGYSKDLSFGIKQQKNNFKFHTEITAYHNLIDNQIQWVPLGQVWTPINISRTETIGLELKWNSSLQLSSKSALLFNLNYAYTDAQIKEKSPNESDEVLNKQLIYIPFYQGNAYVGYEYNHFLIDVIVQYVGYQFTRADNLEWLDAYLLTDLGFRYTLEKSKYNIQFFTKANNLFNTIYQVRQWYPMPQMNYEIGINLKIK